MNFLYADNQIVVAFKPHNLKFEEFLTQVKQQMESENQKTSYMEAIYPICAEASGIVLLAVSSKAKQRLLKQVEDDQFLLRSFAVCVGEPEFKNNLIFENEFSKTSKFFFENKKFVARNSKTKKLEYIPQLTKQAKQIKTTYQVLQSLQKISLVKIDGGFCFEDETRFVLSDANSPVFGDKVYGGEGLAKNTNLALCLVEIKFVHPTTQKNMTFRVFPETQKKPWSYFNVEKFLRI